MDCRTIFSQLQQESSTSFQFGKWGELYKQLASPTFWEYKTTAKEWSPGTNEAVGSTPGGGKPFGSNYSYNFFLNSLLAEAKFLKTGPSTSRQQTKKN